MVSPEQEQQVLAAAREGDRERLWELLQEYRERLLPMVNVRMHPRLRGRVDPSDVLQESLLEVSERLTEYLDGSDLPFFLWVRLLTGQKLMQFHRRHLDAKRRDVRRELRLAGSGAPAASSIVLADALLASGPSPSQVVSRDEELERLRRALEEMKESDREVLVLRHFEQLKNSEVAQLLEIQESTASQRYLRALERLRQVLDRFGDSAPTAEDSP